MNVIESVEDGALRARFLKLIGGLVHVAQRVAEDLIDGVDEVHRKLAPKLLGFLFRQTRNRARAEDLVQQTFLQMHCAREAYVTGADVLPWAFAIARRLSIDAFRRGKREVQDNELQNTALAEHMTPDDMLRSKQAAELIQQTLEALPEAQRTAFELIKYDGLSVAQAAEALGTTVTAVKLRAHRTYEALRSALRDDVIEKEFGR